MSDTISVRSTDPRCSSTAKSCGSQSEYLRENLTYSEILYSFYSTEMKLVPAVSVSAAAGFFRNRLSLSNHPASESL